MGPDCTDIFLEQLPHVGFRFCFTSAVMSPGCPGGLGSSCWPAPRTVGGGGGWGGGRGGRGRTPTLDSVQC